MKKRLVTTKITPKALDALRIVSDLKGMKQYAMLERLVLAELEKTKIREDFEREATPQQQGS